MADKLQNTSSVKTNTFVKGMVKDYADMYMPEGAYIQAINAINNTHYGESGTIGNEPSNKECTSAPYAIIGFAYKNNNQWVLFSTNRGTHTSSNIGNDIGIFDEATCTYTSIFNEGDNKNCLNFAVVSPITAVCKENYDCTWSVYWQDAHNSDRVINLDNPPYISNGDLDGDPCTDPGVSQVLDCDAIRLHPLVQQPCLQIRKSQGGGQLINGSYMALIAYTENGIRLTDYSMPSPTTSIWTHEGVSGSIEILAYNLDSNFDEYELVIVATNNQQTIAKKVGNYPITTTTIHLDQILQTLPTIDISLLPMKSVIYEKSDKMFEINNYLIRSGVTSQPYFNYQPLANKIKTEWVAVEYPKDYYFSGGTSVGYMRDEVYAFFIRWVYKTGARSASFHIPGRAKETSDSVSTASNINKVYSNELEKWQVYDTSTVNSDSGSVFDSIINVNPARIVNSGKMAYWESKERYPVNTEIWGDLCNEPIRHHKIPSDETIPLSRKTSSNEEFINVIGVRFENINHPTDQEGNIIEDIIGYEILRGTREGNKSIIAKGLFNNMWEFDIPGISTNGLFQNYPYNDLRDDPFLVTNAQNMTNSNIDPKPLSTYKKNIFSFHSPETTFLKPYIGDSYIKLSKEAIGTSKGRYEIPYLHPRHKIITDATFFTAVPLAIGIGLVAALGKTSFKSEVGATTPVASTLAHAQRDAGAATAIPDLVANIAYQTASVTGLGSVAATIAGVTLAISNFMYFFGEGMDQILSVIRNISKWRDYALQFNSHGLYDKWANVSNNGVLPSTTPCIRRKCSTVKYIGSH
ncbi:MAG: hypothetical protein EOL97_14010, partial [Spirochaetia bacterium]|nr:hypothetical protein [Spirochaetia bacterium]